MGLQISAVLLVVIAPFICYADQQIPFVDTAVGQSATGRAWVILPSAGEGDPEQRGFVMLHTLLRGRKGLRPSHNGDSPHRPQSDVREGRSALRPLEQRSLIGQP